MIERGVQNRIPSTVMKKSLGHKTHVLLDGLNIARGGGLIVLERLALAFSKAGCAVTVLLARDVPVQPEVTRVVRVLYIPEAAGAAKALIFRYVKLSRLTSKIGANLIFSFNYYTPSSLPQITYHVNVIPFLSFAQRRNSIGFAKAIVLGYYARKALRRSMGNLFESRHLKQLADESEITTKASAVAYIGIDVPGNVEGLSVHNRENRLVAITSGAGHKRNDLLLEAFRRYKSINSNAELYLLGDEGAIRASLASHDRNAVDTDKSVIFAGYLGRNALYEKLASAKALITFSELESFYMVALESMAVGCPVVAADISSVRESVGNAGLLFPPGDVAAAVEQLSSLNDESRWLSASESGRDWAARFEADRCAADVVGKALAEYRGG